MVYINASGIQTFLLKEGKGKPAFILIHGAAWNHRLWSGQVPAISSLGEVIALDLPGHGASDQFASMQDISIKSYADHIHSVLSVLNEPNAVLVGHSMGGTTSMRYALDQPNNVKAMVLIGTGAKLGVNPAILEGLTEYYEQTIEASKAWAFATRTDKRIVEAGIGEMIKCRQEIVVADFKACNEFDIRDSVSGIHVPTLILVGSEDKLTPVKWSEYLHNNMKGSELEIIEGAGHMVMLEKPNEVNKCITSFIERARVT
nr:alpha/beta hydrolase [Candidatus Njordarchaeota archaeon]